MATLSIYMTQGDTSVKLLASDIDLDQFQRFSDYRLTDDRDTRVPVGSIALPRNSVDEAAALRLIDWIRTNDAASPTHLTPDALNLEVFDDMVHILVASRVFRIEREFRGEELRNTILEYLRQGPLSLHEFALVMEGLHFDHGLVKTAMRMTMYHRAKGGHSAPPEMEGIERFCRQRGWWGDMVGMREGVARQVRWERKEEERKRREEEMLRALEEEEVRVLEEERKREMLDEQAVAGYGEGMVAGQDESTVAEQEGQGVVEQDEQGVIDEDEQDMAEQNEQELAEPIEQDVAEMLERSSLSRSKSW